MTRLSTALVLVAALGTSSLLATAALAQSSTTTIGQLPVLPQASPSASVTQQVGISSVGVTYSSPAQNDRTIWGELVPWGEVWRAGANAATKVEVSTDFTFGGTPVPAGSYSLFIIPTESSFTFVLNTDSSGSGAYAYNEAENVATFEATPTEGPDRERMIFLFTDTTNDSTTLTLEWAGMTAGVAIGVDTAGIARASIDANLSAAWRPHFASARFLLESGGDLEQAAAWMTTSIAIQENWWNHWFMARIQAGLENYDAAREHAARAGELGAGNNTWETFFRADAEAEAATWPN
jgi:hypothetical protein